MPDKLVLELSITDSGTPVIKKFSMEAKDALGQATQGTNALTGSLGKNKDSWALMAAGAASAFYMLEKVYAIGKDMVDSYAKQEAAEMKLAMAMRNQGEYSAEALRSLTAYATKLQDTTTVSDDAAIGVMALLKTFGMSDEQLKRSTKAVLDLSIVMDKDLNAAAMLLGKAFLGNEQTLGKWGIKIDQTLPPSQKLEAVLTQLEQRFGGTAQAMIETHGGKMAQWKNKVDDAKETVGGMALTALPFMSLALMDVNVAMGETTKATSSIENAMAKLPPVVGGFKPVADETVKGLDKLNKALEKFALEQSLVGATDLQKQIGMLQVEVKEYEKAELDKTKILQFQSEARNLLIAQYQQKQKEIEIVAAGKEIEAHLDHLNALALQKAEMQKGYNEQELKNTIATIEAIGKASDDYFDKLTDDTRRSAETWIAQDKRATEADLEYKAQMVIATKTGLAREIAEIERGTDIKIREYERQLKENLINQKTFDTLILSANAEKNTKIGKATEENAKWILNVNKSMQADIAAFTHNEYALKAAAIEEEYALRKSRMGDSKVLEQWREIELIKLNEERTLRQGKFWDDTKAAYDQDIQNQTTWGEQAVQVWNSLFGTGGTVTKAGEAFWGGMKVAYNQDIRNQTTWGEQGATLWRGLFGPSGAFFITSQTFFVDLFHGHLQTAEDYFNVFKDAVIAAIAQMIARWVAFQAMTTVGGWLGFNEGGTGGAGGGTGNGVGGTVGNAAVNAGGNAAANYITGGTGGMSGLVSMGANAAYNYVAGLLGEGAAAQMTAAELNAMYGVGAEGAVVAGSAAAAAVGAETGMTAAQVGAMYGVGSSFGAGAGAGAGTFATGTGGLGASAAGTGWIAAMLAAWYWMSTSLAGRAPALISEPAWGDVGPATGISTEFGSEALAAGLFKAGMPNSAYIFQGNPQVWMDLYGESFQEALGMARRCTPEILNMITGTFNDQIPLTAATQSPFFDALTDTIAQTIVAANMPDTFPDQYTSLIEMAKQRAMGLTAYFEGLSGMGAGSGVGAAAGGIIDELVIGRGQKTGTKYYFGEQGPEVITPLKGSRYDENNISALIFEVKALRADLQKANYAINAPLVHIEGNLIGDENTFNNFVKKIDYTLTKIRRREYGGSLTR